MDVMIRGNEHPKMDSDPEIIRRLALLDRKLNYVAGLLIAAAALVIGAIVFFLVRFFLPGSELGYAVAAICAVIAGIFAGRYVERPFRRADP